MSGAPGASDRQAVTRLLHAHREGDAEAFEQLMETVYPELRRIARRQLARQPKETVLDTVGLVNDAYVALVDERSVDWQDRGHFFAIAARTMRRLLVDQARRRSAEKRGGGEKPLTLEPGRVAAGEPDVLVLAVDRALEKLESFNPRLARVVECRFYAGMSAAETGRALGVTGRTVERDWTRARAWLEEELAD